MGALAGEPATKQLALRLGGLWLLGLPEIERAVSNDGQTVHNVIRSSPPADQPFLASRRLPGTFI